MKRIYTKQQIITRDCLPKEGMNPTCRKDDWSPEKEIFKNRYTNRNGDRWGDRKQLFRKIT